MGLISTADLERVRRLRETSPTVRSAWAAFAERMIALDDATLDAWDARRGDLAARAQEHGGHKIFSLGNFLRSAVAQAPQLAFFAQIEGNDQARRSALRLCDFVLALPEWRIQAVHNGWRSDLWTAEFCSHLGQTYLQLRGTLTTAQRNRFSTTLFLRGVRPLLDDWIDPVQRIHALDSMGHNWWSVCVSGAALALFSLRTDVPEADKFLTQIAESTIEFFRYPGNVLQNKHRTFGAQGDYVESVGYLDYALHDVVTMADLFRSHLGRDFAGELPVLARCCDYYVACAQPLHDRTQRLNFGNMGAGRDSVGSYNHQPAATWLWLARRFQRDDLFHLVRQTHPRPEKLREFVLWPEDLEGHSFAGAPGDTAFGNTGVAILRDGYHPECTVLAIKTGEIWNHNQPDAGSFILSSAGREFFIDGGALEYSNPRYWSYLRTAEAHNVICHGGCGPDPELDHLGTKFPGSIPVLLSAPDYRYVLADCCGPWTPVYRRFYRHVLWIDDFVLMVDDLHAFQPGAWRQLWHYRGTATIDGPTVTIVNEGESLILHRLVPAERTDAFETGFLPRMQGDDLKFEYALDDIVYLATECPDRGLREKFINLLLLPRHAAKEIRPFGGENHSGVEVRDVAGSWTFLCNHLADGRTMHQNSEIAIGDIRTDAFIVGLHRNSSGRLDRFSLHNGSLLHLAGETLHSSLLKIDAHVAISEERRMIHSHATSSTHVHYSVGDDRMAGYRMAEGAMNQEIAS